LQEPVFARYTVNVSVQVRREFIQQIRNFIQRISRGWPRERVEILSNLDDGPIEFFLNFGQPFRDEVGENGAQSFDEVTGAEVLEIHGIQLVPRRGRREVFVFAFSSLVPGDLLDIARARLLDTVPIVVQRLPLMPDKREPVNLFTLRNTIGFGENTYDLLKLSDKKGQARLPMVSFPRGRIVLPAFERPGSQNPLKIE
jgi:hypothetical protein